MEDLQKEVFEQPLQEEEDSKPLSSVTQSLLSREDLAFLEGGFGGEDDQVNSLIPLLTDPHSLSSKEIPLPPPSTSTFSIPPLSLPSSSSPSSKAKNKRGKRK